MNEKVKVRIRPLHNIGGVGKAGAVVWMSREDAEMYVRDGYVDVVEDAPSQPPPNAKSANLGEGPKAAEDHKIMKPEVKRGRRKK